MLRPSTVIGALALAAMAAMTAQQMADALEVKRGQAELINRPDLRLQQCWSEYGDRRRYTCDSGHGPH